ncbi:YidB family protein, partial [Mesorhizobium sp.]|uniref:YidB family protein n=1 Tax=Mesorhizobium sp. TaxID=1871066 RepID=UPI0025E7CEDD
SAGSPGGLGDILDRLRNAGAGDQVNSWVSRGSNRPVRPEQVEKAIDPQMLDDLAEQTGVRIARATFTRLREQGIIIRSTSDLTSNTFVINSAPVTPQVEEVLQAS